MARIDSLTNFLTDIADAIRSEKGTTGTILAANFDTEIESITTCGGGINIEEYINTIPTSNASSGASYITKNIKKIPPLDLSNLTDARYLFMYCGLLTEIEGELDLGFSSNNAGIFGINGGSSTPNLENVHIKNLNASIDLHYCEKMTKDSLLYLLNNANTVSSGTITLGPSLLSKLTESEISIVTNKGWTVN